MAKDTRPSDKHIRVAVLLDKEEHKRFLKYKPTYVRADGQWARQLILERVSQLDAAGGVQEKRKAS